MTNLFTKIPENFFSILSRKYKAVYSVALLALYDTLKIYKTRIKKSDYLEILNSKLSDMMSLFELSIDRLDDKNSDDEVTSNEPIDEHSSAVKIYYIVRKLEVTGWIEIEKDIRTNIEYVYIPNYAFKFLELFSSLVTDVAMYLPLVHQTYSELKLEDEKEDDYMFKTVLNCRRNVEELELNVTILYHSICVFGHQLTNVFSPNEALRQHFDSFQIEINDKLYHPMKTYDSLGLYAIPTIAILNKWLDSERIMDRLIAQAKNEPNLVGKTDEELEQFVFKTIQEIIDKLHKLHNSFEDIDAANANYTEAVQKKVNYLSSSDKTIQGKIKDILVRASMAIKASDEDYDQIPFIQKMSNTLSIYQQGCIDSDSLTMPYRRSEKPVDDELVVLADPFDPTDDDFADELFAEYSRYGAEGIDDFMIEAFGNKDEITTGDIDFNDMDDFILFILATVRAELDLMFCKMERIDEPFEIIKQGFILPNFHFVKKR